MHSPIVFLLLYVTTTNEIPFKCLTSTTSSANLRPRSQHSLAPQVATWNVSAPISVSHPVKFCESLADSSRSGLRRLDTGELRTERATQASAFTKEVEGTGAKTDRI